MISEHLSKIEGIATYPVLALLLFFVMFVLTIVWVFRLDKKYINRMENIPLESNNEFENKTEIKNEGN